MAGWNGSGMGGNSTPVKPKVTAKKKPSPVRGLLAGAVLVAAVCGAYFAFFSGGEKSQKVIADKKPTRIKEAKPATAPTNAVPAKPKKKWPKWMKVPDDWDKPYPPQAYWPDGRLKEHSRYVKVITNKVSKANMPVEEQTFSNHAEQDIAALLIMEPGDTIVGSGPTYGKAFVKQFLKSLETPIEFSDEDTPFQRDLKKSVIETKKDLKARYDAGEDIAKIMNDSFKELKELSLYRQELEDQVARIRKDKGDLSDEDYKDLLDAANKMLEERGCKPLRASQIFERKMKIKAARLARKEGQKK